MPIINQNQKNSLPNDYWKEVNKQTHTLIADILNQKLPLPNLREKKNFNPEEDADYRTICADYENNYVDNLPTDPEQVAHEITYEYLLLVSKSIIKSLKEFVCHSPEYMEDLT